MSQINGLYCTQEEKPPGRGKATVQSPIGKNHNPWGRAENGTQGGNHKNHGQKKWFGTQKSKNRVVRAEAKIVVKTVQSEVSNHKNQGEKDVAQED